jgi:hypothetical protein
VSITDDNNCVATDSVIICVIDVRCGNLLNKVQICHVPPDNPLNPNTLCVSQVSVAVHLAHGDMLAACGTDHSCPPAEEAFAVIPSSSAVAVGNVSTADHTILVDNAALKETTLTAYPNPSKGSTTVEFTTMSAGWATLKLFDHLGRQVSVLYEGEVEQATQHKLLIDGDGLPSGIYVCTLQADDVVMTKTIILNR